VAARGYKLQVDLGYVSGKAPREAAFAQALEDELAQLRSFLALPVIHKCP